MSDTSDTSAARTIRVQHEWDMSNTSARRLRHECCTSVTQVLHGRNECDTSATRMTRVRYEWKTLFLITRRMKKTYFHTPILAMWLMKDYKEKNNFIRKTTFWKCMVSMPNAFEKCTTKTELCNSENCIKKLYPRL